MKELDKTISTNQLMEYIEAAFYRSGIVTHFPSVKEIIASDENSAAFIREVLDDEYNGPHVKTSNEDLMVNNRS